MSATLARPCPAQNTALRRTSIGCDSSRAFSSSQRVPSHASRCDTENSTWSFSRLARHSVEQRAQEREVGRRRALALTEREDRRAAHGFRLLLVAGDGAHQRMRRLLVALAEPEHGRLAHGLGAAARERHQRGHSRAVGDHRQRANRRAGQSIPGPMSSADAPSPPLARASSTSGATIDASPSAPAQCTARRRVSRERFVMRASRSMSGATFALSATAAASSGFWRDPPSSCWRERDEVRRRLGRAGTRAQIGHVARAARPRAADARAHPDDLVVAHRERHARRPVARTASPDQRAVRLASTVVERHRAPIETPSRPSPQTSARVA